MTSVQRKAIASLESKIRRLKKAGRREYERYDRVMLRIGVKIRHHEQMIAKIKERAK